MFSSTSPLDANRAHRAIGAMFLFAFGGAWLELYALDAFGMQPIIVIAIILVLALLFYVAWRCYRQHQPALAAEPPSDLQTRAYRMFNIINATQWVLIFVVAYTLANIGLSRWIIPTIIFIVGIHFLPLARIFAYPPHYVTGVALVILSVVYPLLAPRGATNPIGCLGAGIILWASAFWAIAANKSFKRTSLRDAA